MAYVNDLKYIRNKLSAFCNDHFKQLRNEGTDPVVICNIQTVKGKKQVESSCNLTEIPSFFFDLLGENNRLMMERNDTKIDKVREDFKLEIQEKDERILDLESQIRSKANELDGLAQYTRRDNLRIEGVEYNEGEDVNAIILEIAEAMGLGEDDLKEADISIGHRVGNIKDKKDSADTTPIGLTSQKNRKPPGLIFRFACRNPKI